MFDFLFSKRLFENSTKECVQRAVGPYFVETYLDLPCLLFPTFLEFVSFSQLLPLSSKMLVRFSKSFLFLVSLSGMGFSRAGFIKGDNTGDDVED